MTSRVNQNINYIFGILLVRAADQYLNESILRWSKGGGVEELGGVLQNFSGTLLQNFKYIVGILSSSPVDSQPFEQSVLKVGVCGHVHKSEARTLGCRPRGESRQRRAIHFNFQDSASIIQSVEI